MVHRRRQPDRSKSRQKCRAFLLRAVEGVLQALQGNPGRRFGFFQFAGCLAVIHLPQQTGERGDVVSPCAMARAGQRVFRVQAGRYHLVQEFRYGIGFEKRYIVDEQYRDLAVRRDLEEPVWFVAQIDVSHFKIDGLRTHHNHGALDPGSSNRTDQVVQESTSSLSVLAYGWRRQYTLISFYAVSRPKTGNPFEYDPL